MWTLLLLLLFFLAAAYGVGALAGHVLIKFTAAFFDAVDEARR